MQTIIISLLVVLAPFVWVWYKQRRNAKEAEKIYWEAKDKFENECKRLGVRRDNQFSDMYTASFIRCDDAKERIAVYAGQSNRFAVIPYRDYGMILCSFSGGVISASGSTQYVTTSIGGTSITTKYSPSQASFYIAGYTPEILVFRDGVRSVEDPGYVFDSTGKIGKSRMEKTKMFCEVVNHGMKKISIYANVKNGKLTDWSPGQNYLEWGKEWDARERALANKPDPYGSHSI